jgi:FTR1 family protein
LLIGLREGLEAGLVVSILLAALRKIFPEAGTAPVWLGVLGAVSLAASFAAVLTFSTAVLSSRAQEAVGGLLSVLAVCPVTGMIFWMRRTAAGLSAHLKGEVRRGRAGCRSAHRHRVPCRRPRGPGNDPVPVDGGQGVGADRVAPGRCRDRAGRRAVVRRDSGR